MSYDQYTSTQDLTGALDPDCIKAIFDGSRTASTVLMCADRMPDASSGQERVMIQDQMAQAYWVEPAEPFNDKDIGYKKTSKVSYTQKFIQLCKLAVIMPVADCTIQDVNYDVMGMLEDQLPPAFGRAIDDAILFGVNKPAGFGDSVVEGATAAGNIVTQGSLGGLYQDIYGGLGASFPGVLGHVESDGFTSDKIIAQKCMMMEMRGAVGTDGHPILNTNPQQGCDYAICGIPSFFPIENDPTKPKLIAGDWMKLKYCLRGDMEFTPLKEATIFDPVTKQPIFHLAQQDMTAIRAVLRIGFCVINPVNDCNPDGSTRYPFSLYTV